MCRWTLTVVVVSVTLSRYWSFTWEYMLNCNMKDCTSFWSLMARRSSLRSLFIVRFLLLLVLYPSIDELVMNPLHDDVLERFPSTFGLWITHCPFTGRCYLHHQYYAPSLVFFTTPPFWIFQNPGWDIPDVGRLSLNSLPVWILWCIVWVIHELLGHSK